MKREVKFRAWNAPTKEMLYSDDFDTLSAFFHEITPLTKGSSLMQFIGLKDKNGEEIYDDDIVLATLTGYITQEIKSIIEYVRGCYGIRAIEDAIMVDSLNQWKSFYGCDTEKRIEIIGNIHENPDLIPNENQ